MSEGPTVWRLVWDESGVVEFRTGWTIHYDYLRNKLDEIREMKPGTDPRIERGTVSEVEDIERMEFPHDREEVEEP